MKCIMFVGVLMLAGCYDERDPEAESCDFLLYPFLGITTEGFRYVEPERGRCIECFAPAWAMSDSALRVCLRSRPDGEGHQFVGLDSLSKRRCGR